MKRAGCLALAASFALAAPSSATVPQEHIWSAGALNQFFTIFRARMARHPSSTLRSVNENAVFRASRSFVPNASAGIDQSGRQVIQFNTQLHLALTYFANLTALDIRSGGSWTPCVMAYGRYVFQRTRLLRTRLGQRLAPVDMQSPAEYAETNGGSCEGLTREAPLSGAARSQVDAEVANAAAFILLHEMGHHALGHTSRPLRFDGAGGSATDQQRRYLEFARQQRARETAADLWAVERSLDVGMFALPLSTTFWQFSMYSNGLDYALEDIDTHPISIRRHAAIARRLETYLTRADDPQMRQARALLRELINLSQRAECQLSMEPPSGC